MAEGKYEAKHEYFALKGIKTVNTQPSREALKEEEAAWLENIMPIGDSFMQVVPAIATDLATVTASIMKMHPLTIGTVNYQLCCQTNGGMSAVNLATGSVVSICAAGTFSGAVDVDQWKSERAMIADPSNGMYSWDGTLFYSPGSLATISVIVTGSGFTSTPSVVITGGTAGTTATAQAILSSGGIGSVTITAVGTGYTAAPAITFSGGGGSGASATAWIMPSGMNGQAIAVYSGRVWVSNNRLLSYTAPNTWYDVSTADAAGSTTITEGSLRLRIYGMEALENYLYVFGDSSILVIGDLKVSGSLTTFSQTFLSSTTGTTIPSSIYALERAIIFVNQYGVYALFGASLTKISKPLDGVFPLINFSDNVSAGLVQIYNILCYVFTFTYNDPNGARSLQAVYFDNKWFFTSQDGNLTYISPISVNGVQQLWGTSGTNVTQLYTNTDAAISWKIITGLYFLTSPIFDKQLITAGIEYTSPAASSLTFQIDTENVSLNAASTSGSSLIWYNNSNSQIVWVNNSNQTITWLATGFLLDFFNLSVTGKYLGATVTSSSPQVAVNGILMEYVQRASW